MLCCFVRVRGGSVAHDHRFRKCHLALPITVVFETQPRTGISITYVNGSDVLVLLDCYFFGYLSICCIICILTAHATILFDVGGFGMFSRLLMIGIVAGESWIARS